LLAVHGSGRGGGPVVIIGAGFGGLAAAIELKRAGIDDLVVLEQADDVGGVWRDNTYPGAACDVPSPLYSFSYARNPRWPKRYAAQPDILEYLREIAVRHGIRAHVQFGTAVTAADYDDATGSWSVHTSRGELIEARAVISAVGQLSRPSFPAIPGRETFAGAAFHSAEWDHSVSLTGKRVAVIGTGASAIQFVPEIAPEVRQLDLYQRTPPYIVPRWDTRFTRAHHALFTALPVTQLAERLGWYSVTELLAVALLYAKPLSWLVTRLARSHMRRQLGDDALLAKVWPSYPIGCKRILFSSDYLPAVRRKNVDLVTDRIARITANGVETVDGVEHPADVLIYATGFTATDFLAPMKIRGRDGRDLRDEWRAGARAHLGITVPHFPNLFLMYGPNTNLGSGSIVFMLECQARYVRQALQQSTAIGAPIAVRPAVEAAFDAQTQSRLAGGVWTQCANWYRNPDGRVTTNWPGTVSEYRRRTARFVPADYEVVSTG
jgi:cation diffusion facilitator CzcD-associated flavoprotein CzcO